MALAWMPNVTRQPEGNGGSMVGGPPRAVWHVTWSELDGHGRMPAFDNIVNYLKSVNYCPHIMWDPFTGRIVQFYGAGESARALANQSGGVETNRMGRACIQVEIYFTPGCIVNGKKYSTVADTPCKGLDEIVAWMRSLGIPDAWPSGWPQWSDNSRSATKWQTKAGHYGHCHVPENDHSDPGPMPRSMFKEADDVTPQDIEKIAEAVWTYMIDTGDGGKPWRAKSVLGNIEKDQDRTNELLAEVQAKQAEQDAKLNQILAALAPEEGTS